MKKTLIALCALMLSTAISAQTIDLSGEWQFGMGDKAIYGDKITLPGSMLTNDKGNPVSTDTQWTGSLYDSSFYHNPYMAKYRIEGQMKFPFFLTPQKHYTGNAWYKRTVDVPKDWKDRRIILHLERPHIETTVYVNGKKAGHQMSLSVPHEFDITTMIKPGRRNTIEIKVYNGIENVCVGQDSHSVTDQSQGNWNGITGRIALEALPKTSISECHIFPSLNGDVRMKTVINVDKDKRTSGKGKTSTSENSEILGEILYEILDQSGKVVCSERRSINEHDATNNAMNNATEQTTLLETTLSIDNPQLWDEFNPNLYTARVTYNGHTIEETFGIREITIEGRQFYINGRPTWMRGTLDCCCFPMTGYPPTDESEWLRIFSKCKEYGINMIRFHSYCPPEAAFTAADKVGIYLQPEGPSWPNHGVRLGRGMAIDNYLLDETRRMVREYGNHPSFCMLAAGNEPAGDWVTWVGRFVEYWQQTGDKRRVYCGASVGGGWAFDPKSEYHVKGGAKGLDWNNRLPQSDDIFSSGVTSFLQKGRKPIHFDITNPLICHEQGQWCAFPNLKETTQYTGAYKPGNLDIFADLLAHNGMASQAEKFLMASGRLQTLAYKYEMERNMRTPEYAGFQLLGLNDYSGQGSAMVGVLNVFWREKGYCTAEDWRQFCAPIVPLARFPKFVFTDNETITIPVEMYNASNQPLFSAKTIFNITASDGSGTTSGTLSEKTIPIAKNVKLGTISINPKPLSEPKKYTLEVTTSNGDSFKLLARNTWEFWVYPTEVEMPAAEDIYIADTLDAKAEEVLAAGGKVLIEAAGKVRLGSDIKQTYLPVFWNTSWFKMRPPHTTGATIDTAHPLFKHFPTDEWANLNWWELINKAQVMNLRELPAHYQPPIQPIDTWHVSRKIGMLIEAKVGGGQLLMTTMNISNNLDQRPVARQMRKAILTYMQSDDFKPSITLSHQTIANFFQTEAPAVDMHTNDSPDELKPKLK